MLILEKLSNLKTREANESITRNYIFSIYGKPKIMVDPRLWHRVIIANQNWHGLSASKITCSNGRYIVRKSRASSTNKTFKLSDYRNSYLDSSCIY